MPRKMVIVGDSHGEALTPFLHRELSSEYEIPATVNQRGISVSGVLQSGELDTALREHRPDTVLVILGGNDRPDAGLASRIYALIRLIQYRGVKRIYWIGPFHATREDVQARHMAVNSVQRQTVPNTRAHWIPAMGYTRQYVPNAPDGYHFTGQGYSQLARWIARAVYSETGAPVLAALGLFSFSLTRLNARREGK